MELYAQNIFFPTEVGTVLTYVQRDARGRFEHYTRQTITAVERSGNEMIISYLTETLDRNRRVTNEINGRIIIRAGKMIFDIESMIAARIPEDSRANVEISGSFIELPLEMSVGQRFDDSELTISVERGIVRMNVVMRVTDVQCLAIENVTVEAGTFRARKVTQTISTTALRRTNTSRIISWSAPNIGQVQSRTYDHRDRLQNTTELIEIRR